MRAILCVFAAVIAGCGGSPDGDAAATQAAVTPADPCAPAYDSPEATTQAKCQSFPLSQRWPGAAGNETYCVMADGTLWDSYPDGTHIRFQNGGEGVQLCYVRNGQVVYRLGDPLP